MVHLQVNLVDTDRAIANSLEVIYIPVDASVNVYIKLGKLLPQSYPQFVVSQNLNMANPSLQTLFHHRS